MDLLGVNVLIFSKNLIQFDIDFCPMRVHGSVKDWDSMEIYYIVAT